MQNNHVPGFTPEDHLHHERFIWTRFATIFLGLWMIFTPLTFTYVSDVMRSPIAPLTWTEHSTMMMWSDIISGILLCLFGAFSLSLRNTWAPWAVAIVGVWLILSPIAFWAPNSLIYLNDSIVGTLAIAFAILIPGTHGDVLSKGPEIPPGWSYNPSSWPQRFPVIVFGFIGWMIARYMASYQLGYLDHVVDPVFPDGTLDVITSKLSKSFPISDAGLGACAYTLEALMGLKGGPRRWYTMPWFVILFGILVVPLGFVSILLVILQPVLVGHWCFWCLFAAVCMLIMISFTVDEVVAVLQYLAKVRREKKNFWQIFWKGGDNSEGTFDTRTPHISLSFWRTLPAMRWGLTPPWNLILTAIIGLWTMFSPPLFGDTSHAATSNHIVGAIVLTISVISMAEVTRSLRYLNILLGIWIAVSTILLAGATETGSLNNIISGILVAILSFPKGKIKERYGSWDSCIK